MKKAALLLLLLICGNVFAQKDTIGIYYQKDNKLIEIEPIKYSKTKTNTLGSALTMGIASSSVKTIYRGSTSNNRVYANSVFYFYFSTPGRIDMSELQSKWMFVNSKSTRDFLIAKFKKKESERELQVAKINIYSGTEMGVADESLSDIKSEKVREGLYRVELKNAAPGEYCFMYNGQMGSGAYMPVFDFSIE